MLPALGDVGSQLTSHPTAMACLDLTLMAELLVATLVVATLDPVDAVDPVVPVSPTPADPPLETGKPGWSPQRDRHAQRILRLEAQRPR